MPVDDLDVLAGQREAERAVATGADCRFYAAAIPGDRDSLAWHRPGAVVVIQHAGEEVRRPECLIRTSLIQTGTSTCTHASAEVLRSVLVPRTLRTQKPPESARSPPGRYPDTWRKTTSPSASVVALARG